MKQGLDLLFVLWHLLLYFGVNTSKKQSSKAFSFGSAWVLCQSLFTFFLLSLVMQTAVYIVSPKPKRPLSRYSALLVLWWEYTLATGHFCEVLLLDTLYSHNMRHGSKFLSLTCVKCGKILTEFWFWDFFLFCFMNVCLLQTQGFLEGRMIWSWLWAWCNVNGQIQAAGTWAPLGQCSDNNIQKD